jgi:hypothetical protein
MAPFRRPGLAEDDDTGIRPTAIRHRALPFHNQPQKIHSMISSVDEEESVVSGLSAMSDLESLYIENSTMRPHVPNQRDQFLLYQRLPPSNTAFSRNMLNPSREEEKESSNCMNGFNDDLDNEDNWEALMMAVTSDKTKRESQKSSNTKEDFPLLSPTEHLNHQLMSQSAANEAMTTKRSSTKTTTKKKKTSADKVRGNKKSSALSKETSGKDKETSGKKKKTKKNASKSKKKRSSMPTTKEEKKAITVDKKEATPLTPKKKEKTRLSLFSSPSLRTPKKKEKTRLSLFSSPFKEATKSRSSS